MKKQNFFKNIFSLLLCIAVVFTGKAQVLKNYSLAINTTSIAYVGLEEQKVYSASEAPSHKQSINLALVPSVVEGTIKLEWYNLSGKDDKLPKVVLGTTTKIVAISFDKDQFDNCKTIADLKRMTGHITANSFSHFAVVCTDTLIIQHCFLFETPSGKRGLIYALANENNALKIVVKI